MSGRGTFDAVCILKILTEKYQSKGKKLFYIFVDLEKVFDRVQISSCYLLDVFLLRFFPNHQLNTAYQTFLAPKSFQYSCHFSHISNGVVTYQNNVSNVKISFFFYKNFFFVEKKSFYLIPFLLSLQCCINIFSLPCPKHVTQMSGTSPLFSTI